MRCIKVLWGLCKGPELSIFIVSANLEMFQVLILVPVDLNLSLRCLLGADMYFYFFGFFEMQTGLKGLKRGPEMRVFAFFGTFRAVLPLGPH